ncbi:MAG: ComEC/Rec2 family competence protein [Candidatus Pacebacteria bacterium]|nr:ComEC/Rec2 family competence protein [Candidatus Paceibacterota bacterium]
MDRSTSTFTRLDIFLFVLIIVLCALRISQLKLDPALYNGGAGNHVTQIGKVANITLGDFGQSFTLLTENNANLLVRTKFTPKIEYGDTVEVSGMLTLPENFTTNLGTEFDYISYLKKDSILFIVPNAKVSVHAHGGSRFIKTLLFFKEEVLKSLHRVFSPRDANFIAGLDLGEKSAIDSDFRDDLVTTGTIHIIALSGQNVSIIATALRDFFVEILGFSPIVASVSGSLGILFFVAMTGFQSSAVRAGIMAIIAIYGRGTGKQYNAFRALLFAAFLMIMWDPKYLLYDVSFQLSFLATLGIIFIMPILERRFVRVPKKILWIMPLREILAGTLGAQIAVLPFILYKMGTLSLIALPANILILPLIPYAMGFGALAGAIGFFSVYLAVPFSYITHALLSYIVFIVTRFADVPYASLTIKHVPLVLTLVLYLIIIFFTYRAYKKPAV